MLFEFGVIIMNTQSLVLHGRIQADGTLQIEEKVNLPPGPVSVTVRSVTASKQTPTLRVLEDIWAQREAQGLASRTAAEIDAEINAMRNADEDRTQSIDSIPQQHQSKQG